MDPHKLEELPLFKPREGKELLHQGDFAHEFMVVLDGQAEVLRDSEHVADLSPGDFLGEAAALDRSQRNATVVARSSMTVLVMTDRDLRHIARDMPDVDQQLRAAAREHCPLTSS